MKIIEIIPQLSQGGAERFVIDLCNQLAEEHEVMLVVLHSIDNHGFFKKDLSTKVQLLSMNKKKGMDWRLFLRLTKLIIKENPDVVHTHLRSIVYVLFACILPTNLEFFHTIHSDAKVEAGGGLGKWCRKFLFKIGRVHPVTISEESKRSFEDFYHLPSTLIYNGRPKYDHSIDISAINRELYNIKANKDAALLVNVARIQPPKNQLVLAKAIDKLNKEGVHVELAIIGSMDDKRIVDDIENLSSPYVHILGVRSNPRDYICTADAFCLPSIYEGMPITLIECFSVGSIPLCSPVGGIINVIRDGVNGILAKSSNQEDVEEMIKRFLSLKSDDVRLLKKNSLSTFDFFDMKKCTESYVSLFNLKK